MRGTGAHTCSLQFPNSLIYGSKSPEGSLQSDQEWNTSAIKASLPATGKEKDNAFLRRLCRQSNQSENSKVFSAFE